VAIVGTAILSATIGQDHPIDVGYRARRRTGSPGH
jgi:hypothetical protein